MGTVSFPMPFSVTLQPDLSLLFSTSLCGQSLLLTGVHHMQCRRSRCSLKCRAPCQTLAPCIQLMTIHVQTLKGGECIAPFIRTNRLKESTLVLSTHKALYINRLHVHVNSLYSYIIYINRFETGFKPPPVGGFQTSLNSHF